ncbi:MAG TPA: hypothetical protein VNH19_17630 [Candidatus Limnocylindrales bacterium]|nr:hypothetical protein [Candidatus Limnocylindrales bacterium]
MKRFWLSWVQPTEDYRPLKDPPNEAIIGWWCSGSDSDDHATLCAVVDAKNESAAKKSVQMDWPEATSWRFCDAVARDYQPGDRFPVSGWSKERFAAQPHG